MPPSYVILQTEMQAPPEDIVRRALRALKRLTEADAIKLAKEVRGILLKNLELDEARALQGAFQAEGIATQVLEATQLPSLPDAKCVRRAEFNDDALVIYDPLGRPVPVPWSHLHLIAAGAVRRLGITQTRTEEVVPSYNPIQGARWQVVTDIRHKVTTPVRFILDLILTRGALRFQIEAESFLWKFVLDRPDLELVQKLALFVGQLRQRAPQAVMNHGARLLLEGDPLSCIYPHVNVLADEETWLLWLHPTEKFR